MAMQRLAGEREGDATRMALEKFGTDSVLEVCRPRSLCAMRVLISHEAQPGAAKGLSRNARYL